MSTDATSHASGMTRDPTSRIGTRVFVGFLSTGVNALALALPLALLQVYDRILPNQSAGSAIVIFSAVVVALCLSGILRYVRSGIFARRSAEEEHRLWTRTAGLLVSGHYGREEALLLASVPGKARDMNVGQTMLARFDAPFSIVFILLIAYLGGIVVAAPLLVAGVSLLIFLLAAPRNRTALQDEQRAKAKFEESVSALANVPSNTTTLGSLGAAFSRLVHARGLQAQASRKIQGISSLQMDLLQSGALISTVGVVWLGATEVLAGDMTTGGLAACTLLGSRATSQLVGVAATVLRGQPAAVAAQQAQQVLDANRESEHDPKSGTTHLPGSDGGGIWLLEDSDRQTATEKVKAIVSHLSALSATTGDVRVVAARPRLLSGSLIENLSRLDGDLEDEARAASHDLGLTSLVARLPHGYDTEVTSAGRPLPDGGTKRAAIVQAFVGNPAIVVLEAPEASLDADSINKLGAFLKVRSETVKIILQTSSIELRKGLEGAASLDDPGNWIEGVE